MLAMARFFLSKGAIQFIKKYGAKALKDVKKYITKNKLIWDGKKIVEKTTKIKSKVNPRIKNANKKSTKKKDSFDEELKKKEGTKNFNKNNKNINKKVNDTKLTSNVNKTPTMIGAILGKARKHPFATGMVVIPASMGLVNKASNMMKEMTTKSEPKTFAQAFREARKNKGPDAVFTYKGKQYSTVTEDQYKKAGFNSLREYLNAKKKK
tara:strand:- start:2998 stop:3624 length:627 start_codon:yes stop_codon:yes gene_type:complete